MTSARLLRYASFLAGFDYNVIFKKGIENQNVDCLSRAPINQENSSSDISINEEVHHICTSTVFSISSETLTPEVISQETENDTDLKKIIQEIKSKCIENDYTLDEGILFKSHRIMIPKRLQPEVLKELHSTHLGMTKMKQLARRYCSWKTIDKDIENLVKSCKECSENRNNPAKAPVHHWDPPANNWDRIHIDYAGPFQGYNYLVMIDAKSRWAEIKILREAPNSYNTIKLLNEIFSTHGYPFVMVSDNASIFTSEVFKEYCHSNGIKQKFIAPGHPATNGLAERNVQTLKHRLKAMTSEDISIHQKIQKILLRYRATPLADGKSPSELYLNRQIRIKLDAMRPYHEEKSKQILQPHTRTLKVGQRVQSKFMINNKPIWKLGRIKRKIGKLHYIIQLDEGRTLKRHINQLQKSDVIEKRVSFDESTIQAKSKTHLRTPDFYPLQHKIPNPSHRTPDTINLPDPEYLIPEIINPSDPLPSDQPAAPDQQSSPGPVPESQPTSINISPPVPESQSTITHTSPPERKPPLRRSERKRQPPPYLQDYTK